MRVLIVHHGQLPGADTPVTGGALRAWNHGRALTAAGHEVHFLHREQDGPGGFSSSTDLIRHARAIHPDRIICLQIEDAPALGELACPLAIDLYAPRLIEAAHQENLSQVTTQTLCALAAGDIFLVSNPRQEFAWLGVLAMAGIDITQGPTLHIPLVAPDGPKRRPPQEPILIGGGASWPWQNPNTALGPVLDFLDQKGTGKVVWVGGTPLVGDSKVAGWTLPEHPRLELAGWMPYPQLLETYSKATLAIDTAPPGPERSLALRFRHVDYLGCGLPIATTPDTPIATHLGQAGWVADDLLMSLEQALTEPAQIETRSTAARALGQSRFGLDQCQPLLAWMEEPRTIRTGRGPIVDAAMVAARASTAEAEAKALHAALEQAKQEVAEKREEVLELHGQVRSLIDSQQHLTHAIDEVAGFKREVVGVLGHRIDLAERSRQELERELGLLRADNEKKSAELLAMDSLRARLEHDIENLRKEVLKLRQKGLFRRK